MPLKHKKSRQKHRKEGAKPDPTAKYRVRFWREAKSHDMTVPQYRAWIEEQKQKRYEARKAEREDWKRRSGVAEFELMIGGTVTDFKSTHALWKRTAFSLHPDRGGDPAKMARLNELWAKVQQQIKTSIYL